MHRKEEGERGAGSGLAREEFLCLLIRGHGFKGSGRTQPWPRFGSSGTIRERGICRDGARTEWGPGAHPASLLHSDVWGCLSVRC